MKRAEKRTVRRRRGSSFRAHGKAGHSVAAGADRAGARLGAPYGRLPLARALKGSTPSADNPSSTSLPRDATAHRLRKFRLGFETSGVERGERRRKPPVAAEESRRRRRSSASSARLAAGFARASRRASPRCHAHAPGRGSLASRRSSVRRRRGSGSAGGRSRPRRARTRGSASTSVLLGSTTPGAASIASWKRKVARKCGPKASNASGSGQSGSRIERTRVTAPRAVPFEFVEAANGQSGKERFHRFERHGRSIPSSAAASSSAHDPGSSSPACCIPSRERGNVARAAPC